jgi:hypothetical protein
MVGAVLPNRTDLQSMRKEKSDKSSHSLRDRTAREIRRHDLPEPSASQESFDELLSSDSSPLGLLSSDRDSC